MGLIVLGTVALDDVKTPSGIKKNMLGGSAAHFTMSARLFEDVHVVGVVGKDFPKVHLNFLKSKGASLSSLTVAAGDTFRWTGEYKKDDLNSAITHATHLGVLADYEPQLTEQQRKMTHVFLANLAPSVQAKLLSLIRSPELIGLDTMNLWINTAMKELRRLIKRADIFVLNDGEARLLTGELNTVQAARCIKAMGPQVVVVKKGEHGVYVLGSNFEFGYPAFPISKVVDPTGAGDTFAGAMFGYLTKVRRIDEKNFRKAVQYGTVLASFNVQGFGVARTASLSLRDVEARLKQFQQFAGLVNP
ncbi:MAG: bifunctional hydroxymethylpyrimidine kinase/phosphomethylpyrimidine kinase [Candidatus Omnitrophica bacterium]|nr:bifunctional hydroxymethylpyrimidine kinase/phosphomethylpyrimidine kinase [Candidatus Omnitrophota bacterium]